MSADETKVLRVPATFEIVPPLEYGEIAWRFGAAALTSGEPAGTRTAFRSDRLCLEEERAHAALDAQNYQEAARLFDPLAERGSKWAHAILGWMHLYGHLGPPNVAKAIAALEKAASPGYGDAKYYLGLALLKQGDRDRAETVFREGAAENDARCASELMRIEETRAWEAFEACDDEKAARLYEPLAARGSTHALINLGWIYEHGRLGAPDPQKAISLWEEAARLGSLDAENRIARTLLRNGDPVRARALFLKGAEQGYKPSIYWAGRTLVRGQGGEPDRAAGVALLTRAADAGHVPARRELLRLELKETRSVLDGLKVRAKIVRLLFVFLRRAIREPDFFHSDDAY